MNFNPLNIKTKPLSERISKSNIKEIAVNPDSKPPELKNLNNIQLIKNLAQQIKQARKNNKPVIITFGAHLIKNGLSPIIIKLIQQNLITHLATNGAGSIHDWEFAYQGKTEEDVRYYAQQGQFGLWNETGKYINQAIIQGANNNLGYGESIGKMIQKEELTINNTDNLTSNNLGKNTDQKRERSLNVSNFKDINKLQNSLAKASYEADVNNNKKIKIPHPFKNYSIQATAYEHQIPFTVHPCLGQDIIHISPYCNFQAIGKTAQIDFNKFINSILNLEQGVYISIGSAIMSPMIFEKALSVAKNIAHQQNKQITNFTIIINDIQDSGNWDWKTSQDPPKTSPAYYLRFCKTFHRMGSKEMHYIQEDNRAFLQNLYNELTK